ncbi:MAG: hypothetical protein NTV09_06155 [Bacteroidetes bacterium]|nr:hypothetical protein [Bacteroidota bacterium]
MSLRWLLIICSCILGSCAPMRFVKPLEKKQQAANISLGGELIKYNSLTIPVPFLTANYGYGIDSSLTGFASLNITSALFGNFHLGLGATKQLLKQNGYCPAFSVAPAFDFIYRNKNAVKFYPQLAVNAFWEYGKKNNLVYLGIDNWFELASKRAYGQKQENHWIFMPALGHSFCGKKGSFNTEVRVIAPNLSNEKLVVEYQTPLKTHGAFGVYIGYTRKF